MGNSHELAKRCIKGLCMYRTPFHLNCELSSYLTGYSIEKIWVLCVLSPRKCYNGIDASALPTSDQCPASGKAADSGVLPFSSFLALRLIWLFFYYILDSASHNPRIWAITLPPRNTKNMNKHPGRPTARRIQTLTLLRLLYEDFKYGETVKIR